MFVPKIGNIDKIRFGINFKANDIKCKVKEDKNLLKKPEDKNKHI